MRIGGLTLGAASGAISAVVIVATVGLGGMPGIELFGVCLGFRVFDCTGAPLGFYVAPGLIFGLAFGGVFLRYGRLRWPGVVGLCVGLILANALAVTTALTAHNAFAGAGPAVLQYAAAGALAGAVGGGLAALVARGVLAIDRIAPLLVVGAALGVLLPLGEGEWDWPGVILFYTLWQSGYAATLTAQLPARARAAAPA